MGYTWDITSSYFSKTDGNTVCTLSVILAILADNIKHAQREKL